MTPSTVTKIGMVGLASVLVLIGASFWYLDNKIKALEINDEARVSQQTMSEEEKNSRAAFIGSMNYRLVANCDSFVDTVSASEEKAKEQWGDRCRKEKSGEEVPISNIEINRISIRDNKAFIQANITRAIDLGENVTYTGTYEMILEDGNWKLLGPKG